MLAPTPHGANAAPCLNERARAIGPSALVALALARVVWAWGASGHLDFVGVAAERKSLEELRTLGDVSPKPPTDASQGQAQCGC